MVKGCKPKVLMTAVQWINYLILYHSMQPLRADGNVLITTDNCQFEITISGDLDQIQVRLI